MFLFEIRFPTICCIAVLLALALQFEVKASEPYILVDATNGKILAQNKPNDRWHPASLTKLMTAYVTFRAVRNLELEDGSPVVISRKAANQPPGKMGFKRGVRIRVDTALKIIIVKSANDVSVALAEAVAGTVDNFVERMNAEARRLGLVNTRFKNTNGLHNSAQYTSARDMALLTLHIKQEYSQYASMFEAVAIKFGEKTHYSYNLLLERFPGATGMKTGFVCAAGYNMVASATRNEKSLIAVVLGTDSQTDRAEKAARLLKEGFDGKFTGTSSIYRDAIPGTEAKNMRPILCTENARSARYDPAGGKAVIKSEYLLNQLISGKVLPITAGGIDADPSDAYFTAAFKLPGKVPVPQRNPGFKLAEAIEPGAQPVKHAKNWVPVPTPRPR